MPQDAPKKSTLFQKGQSGNPAGRPKGSRSRLQEDFLQDFCEMWETHGKAALEHVAVNDPATFVKVAASILPKELKAEVQHSAVMRMPGQAGSVEDWLSLNAIESGNDSGEIH